MLKSIICLTLIVSFTCAKPSVITSTNELPTKTVYDVVIPNAGYNIYYIKNFELLRKKKAKEGDIAVVSFENGTKVRYVNIGGKSWRLRDTDKIANFPTDTKQYFRSCKSILNNNPSIKSGFYTIDIDGIDFKEPFRVYCDMKSDGGGWTRFLKYKDSISYKKVSMKKKKKFLSYAYKIALNQKEMGYDELMLNDCKTGHVTMSFEYINPDIVQDWIQSEDINGVTKSKDVNSCLKSIKAKNGNRYFYSSDLSHKDEFETIQFSSKCIDYVNGASTAVWGAVDAGNKYRKIWGSVNGIQHTWKNDMKYHNDMICAQVR